MAGSGTVLALEFHPQYADVVDYSETLPGLCIDFRFVADFAALCILEPVRKVSSSKVMSGGVA